MHELIAGHHGKWFDVRRYVDNDRKQAVIERLKAMVWCRDDLVEYYNQQIGICACEHGHVHYYATCVRLIEAHTEIPFAS